MANPFVHVELNTTDLDKAKSFYRSLFDWQLNDVDMGGGMSYTLINVGEGTGGGMMKQMVPGAPSSWLAYVQVDDIRAATDKAKSLGATVMPARTRCWPWMMILSPSLRPCSTAIRPSREVPTLIRRCSTTFLSLTTKT